MREQLSEVGDSLRRRLKCRPCEATYEALNIIKVDVIERKRQAVLARLLKDSGGKYSLEELDHWLTQAIERESRIRGMGDVIHRAARVLGIKGKRNCGCGKRRARLNRIIPFSRN